MDTRPNAAPAANDQFLDTAQAAHYLGKSKATLEWWRLEKRGPTFYRIGHRISYKQSDLDAFMEAGRVVARVV